MAFALQSSTALADEAIKRSVRSSFLCASTLLASSVAPSEKENCWVLLLL
jgi:hypothetical protein